MYNTEFKVKYKEIEEELCLKLKNKTEEEYEENSDEEYEYKKEDVIDICHKLYIDEFISVFGADDILDDKIDLGMKYVFEQMCLNIEFNKIIEEMTQISLKTFMPNCELDEQKISDLKQLITLTLFSQNIFYITHKCICQQFETGTIDDDLLVQLKSHSLEHLKLLCP
jgi:hypothetical protein